MNEQQTHLDWSFGLKWLLSCAIGTAVFGMAAYGSMWEAAEAVSFDNELIGVAVAGALFGAFFALGGTLGPGLLLRKLGISPGRWIGYSVVVAALAMSLGVSLIFNQDFNMSEAVVSTLFIGLTFGLSLGLVQWWLLQRQGVSAAFWPLITVVGYTLAFSIVVFFSGEGREWIALSGMSLLLGAITGLGMMWLLRQETAVVT